MFSLAYVILPFTDTAPADAIAASLDRYRRGVRGEVPDDWLQFYGQTAELREMYEATFTFTRGSGLCTQGGDSWHLDSDAVTAEMERRGKESWTVRFADVEPDLERFVHRFATPFERHPVTGGFGHWHNHLGRWDWWELGGRFDGRIAGNARRPGRSRSAVSSGPSRGRAVLDTLRTSIEDALGQAAPADIDVRTDDNVELVSKLLSDLGREQGSAIPNAMILPPGSVDDPLRWIGSWPQIGPTEALTFLGLPDEADWKDIVAAAYARFDSHWAAGVSFHH